jgi:anti-sigma B factor antagonist
LAAAVARKFADSVKILTFSGFGHTILYDLMFCQENIMAQIRPRISVQYAKNATIVSFVDEKILEEMDIRALQDTIMSVIESAGGGINLILDFGNVRFLSSAVLGLLIRISKRVYEVEGRLKLCNINPKIYEVFKITRLTKTFDIYSDVDACEF